MIEFDQILESESILLRPMQKQDFSHFYVLTRDLSMWDYFPTNLSNKEELEKWVESGVQDTKNKQRLAFTIIDKLSKSIIGSTSLGNISIRDKRIENGWTWICKPMQGRGKNAACKALILKYCFEQCGFLRVEYKTDVLNIPARKALQKIGLIEEGILRSHTLLSTGRRRDTIYYSLLASEWEKLKAFQNWG